MITLQKLLNNTECPSCSKTNVLLAVLQCNRDEKKCTSHCQCGNCGKDFIIDIPDSIDLNRVSETKFSVVECNIETSTCTLKAA